MVGATSFASPQMDWDTPDPITAFARFKQVSAYVFKRPQNSAVARVIGSFRFEDEDEDEDEDEALCFHHNEIFKLFRLQLDRDDEVDCNNIVTPSLSRI